MQAMGSVMNFGMNALLGAGTAVAFFGAYFRLQSFLFMPMNGLSQACLPIIGYNYGAKNPDRIRETVKTALKWGIALGLLFTVLFMALPAQLLSLFNVSADMLVLGVPAIRIICVTFAPASVTMILGLCASGLGSGTINMISTTIRQVILLLPCFAEKCIWPSVRLVCHVDCGNLRHAVCRDQHTKENQPQAERDAEMIDVFSRLNQTGQDGEV